MISTRVILISQFSLTIFLGTILSVIISRVEEVPQMSLLGIVLSACLSIGMLLVNWFYLSYKKSWLFILGHLAVGFGLLNEGGAAYFAI